MVTPSMAPPKRTRSIDIKGNSGASARRRRQTQWAMWIVGFLVVYVGGTTIYQSHFAGMFVPDIETDEFGRTRIRRRPQRHRQKLDPGQKTTEMDAVLEGFLTLVDLYIPPSAMQGIGVKYQGVTAKFCHIDWKLQEKEPYQVPLFHDLMRQSKLCDTTMISVDLFAMAEKAREYDSKLEASKDILAVPPTGFIFHESRCGSTLLANLLGGFSPDHSRVYSENNALNRALQACDLNACFPSMHTRLIQDVFYLTGRTIRKSRPQYVFYKFSSVVSFHLSVLTAALPKVPWTYVYRDTVEVMQSHLAPSAIGGVARSKSSPPCLRNQKQSHQPIITQQIATSKGHPDTSTMTAEEYCATHLAALSEAAIQEYDRSGRGRFVNYRQLPDITWNELLPQDYQIGVTGDHIQRMQKLGDHYSKDRGRTQNASFESDSAQKQESASAAIKAAAAAYAGETFRRMEEISKGHS